MRNPKAIFKRKVSVNIKITPLLSNSEFSWVLLKDSPYSMCVMLKRFRLSLISELQDLILDSSNIL